MPEHGSGSLLHPIESAKSKANKATYPCFIVVGFNYSICLKRMGVLLSIPKIIPFYFIWTSRDTLIPHPLRENENENENNSGSWTSDPIQLQVCTTEVEIGCVLGWKRCA
jgi:hypothetical protein